MAGYNQEQIFKELASRYVEHYGEMLKDEAAALNRQTIITPRMDGNIRRHIKSNRTRRYATGLLTLAAAVALALIIPSVMNLYRSDMTEPSVSAPASEAPAAEAPSAEAPAHGSEAPSAPELIPISFNMPGNLTVTDSKLDNGKSVYYLSNSELDDIVMTMELAPEEDVFAGLKETTINGHEVFYKYAADYSVMAFEQQDVTYVLTCKYDVNTLLPLAEAILEKI